MNGCWSKNEEERVREGETEGNEEEGKGEERGSLFTATNKVSFFFFFLFFFLLILINSITQMSRKNLVAKYKEKIDSLYVQSTVDLTLAGFLFFFFFFFFLFLFLFLFSFSFSFYSYSFLAHFFFFFSFIDLEKENLTKEKLKIGLTALVALQLVC